MTGCVYALGNGNLRAVSRSQTELKNFYRERKSSASLRVKWDGLYFRTEYGKSQRSRSASTGRDCRPGCRQVTSVPGCGVRQHSVTRCVYALGNGNLRAVCRSQTELMNFYRIEKVPHPFASSGTGYTFAPHMESSSAPVRLSRVRPQSQLRALVLGN